MLSTSFAFLLNLLQEIYHVSRMDSTQMPLRRGNVGVQYSDYESFKNGLVDDVLNALSLSDATGEMNTTLEAAISSKSSLSASLTALAQAYYKKHRPEPVAVALPDPFLGLSDQLNALVKPSAARPARDDVAAVLRERLGFVDDAVLDDFITTMTANAAATWQARFDDWFREFRALWASTLANSSTTSTTSIDKIWTASSVLQKKKPSSGMMDFLAGARDMKKQLCATFADHQAAADKASREYKEHLRSLEFKLLDDGHLLEVFSSSQSPTQSPRSTASTSTSTT